MAVKKYLSLERLAEYDELIKAEISEGDAASLASAKSYTDTEVAKKADSSHNHDGRYYTETEIDTKIAEIDGKIAGKADSSHTHSNYVQTSRTINGKALTSNITLTASDIGALSSSTAIPSIDGLATEEYVDDIAATKVDKVSGKGLSTNDYTTTEKNKLAGIASGAEVNQNAFSNVVVGSTTIAADSKTDSLTIAAGTGISVSGDATNDKVTITNSGVRSIATGSTNGTISVNTNGSSVDVAVKGLGSAAYKDTGAFDAAGAADTALASAKTYADNAATKVKNDLLNGAGTAYDTLKELGDLIVENADAIDALETIASGKADAEHTHEIADVSGLQTALDGKAATSHGSHVSFDSTNKPKMDGTAAFGTSSKVARADHVHPTDTSRASQTDLDALETVVAGKANTSHSHAISDVTDLQTTLDTLEDSIAGKAESSHSHTITATATDDDVIVLTGTNGSNKVTFDAKHATSGVTAGTYKSVTVNAYGHVTGGTNPTTLSEYGITNAYTKTEVDSALSGKAASSHSHDAATTSAAGFMTAAMVTKLNGIATGATKITVDSALSSTSTNPVQNKVVNSAISTLTSTVSANTSSISSHSTAISNLQTAVSEIQEITSADIQALFA